MSVPLKIFANVDNKTIQFTEEEKAWLKEKKDNVFIVGINPYTGIEHFMFNNEDKGYISPLLNRISKDLGIKFRLETSKSWEEVYFGLQKRNIDILGGANETSERKQFMEFTKPIVKIPYGILAKKDGDIHTIGDIDKKEVGFVQGDFVEKTILELYKNIKINKKFYKTQEEAINGLRNDEVHAAIIPGGPIIYDYIYRYPDISYAFKIATITSDMTFSTRKEDKILIDILNKEIEYLKDGFLEELINRAEVNYNIKTMNLSVEEQLWLYNDGTAVVGVTKDYLPFDYYIDGEFKGIDGEIIKEISRMTGIKFKYYYSDFDDLALKLKNGEINLLNIAKTDERLKDIIYPQPFSTERDIIVGRKDVKDVKDIFGLEGKCVAVIKGFWHNELLNKNLTSVKIIETNSIQESMRLVHKGEADYLIENPTVVRYYVEELQYYDLVQRGSTSTDSFLYFGISKNKPELASIVNKAISMMDISDISRKGYEEVPHRDHSKDYKRLIFTIVALLVLLVLIIIYVMKLINDLIREKTEKELLKQREYLLSIDSLTEIHNRNYFNTKVLPSLDSLPFPQALVVADMNDLKIVNDNYGHQSGDMLLKLFSQVLRESCTDEVQLFRMGGDEFFIFITNTSEEKVIEIVKKIIENIKSKVLVLDEDNSFNPTAAFGYSIRYTNEITFDELYKIADLKMYNDKSKYK
jgi:diguanylate cyclase (GGDEF)-like protein